MSTLLHGECTCKCRSREQCLGGPFLRDVVTVASLAVTAALRPAASQVSQDLVSISLPPAKCRCTPQLQAQARSQCCGVCPQIPCYDPVTTTEALGSQSVVPCLCRSSIVFNLFSEANSPGKGPEIPRGGPAPLQHGGQDCGGVIVQLFRTGTMINHPHPSDHWNILLSAQTSCPHHPAKQFRACALCRVGPCRIRKTSNQKPAIVPPNLLYGILGI